MDDRERREHAMINGSRSRRAGIVVLTVLVIGGFWAVEAPAVECGAVITTDIVMDTDLECASTAIVIGAADITLDLNGHALNSIDGEGVGVDNSGGFDGVTVKNGVIDGFKEAITAEDSSRLTLKGIDIPSVSGKGIIPGVISVVGAVRIVDSDLVVIEDSSISVMRIPNGPDAILLKSVEGVRVENVNVDGGHAGVNFASCGNECPPLESQPPTNGIVRGCTIRNSHFGVLVINSTDAVIEESEISGASLGIRVGYYVLTPSGITIRNNEIFQTARGIHVLSFAKDRAAPPLPITDLEITGNHLYENSEHGMALVNLHDSIVSDNSLTNNAVWGVRVFESSDGNTISKNIITGNGTSDGDGDGIILVGKSHLCPFCTESGPSENRIFENILAQNTGSGIHLVAEESASPGAAKNQILKNTIAENQVHGINLEGPAAQNVISQNTVEGNQINGINLERSARENVISWNTAKGNGEFDLFHDPASTPNVWDHNCFQTSEGEEVGEPDCGSFIRFRRGDSNADGNVDISDAVCILNWLFLGGAAPGCVAVTNTSALPR